MHVESRPTYGESRLLAAMRREDETIGPCRLRWLMKEDQIRCETRKAYRVTTRRNERRGPAPDLVQRSFRDHAPNELWVADATYVHTREGTLYLAIVLDAFSRHIVGYAMASRQSAELMVTALRQAVTGRRPSARLIHHSDQGSQ